MTELILDKEGKYPKFRIKHDGEVYSVPKMSEHFKDNGHEQEIIGFGLAPGKEYTLASKITKNFRSLFEEKYLQRN